MKNNIICLWSDLRAKSYHQKFIIENYCDVLEKMGYQTFLYQHKHWNKIISDVKNMKPVLFFLHGGKVFPPEVAEDISRHTKIYLRWRWHPDPPSNLLSVAFRASKVSFVNNTYNGKLFYSPHPAITNYFYPAEGKYPDHYNSKICFVGLAGKRGANFYERSKRNYILNCKYVRHINKEKFGNRDEGFYNYEEIAKYYNNADAVLSVSSFDDEVNFRVFNAMACCTPIISDRTSAMDLHFEMGKDYIVYDKNNEKDLMKQFDNNFYNLSTIAHNGYKKILSHHTPEIRIKEALKELEIKC